MKLLVVGYSESFIFQKEESYLYHAHHTVVSINGKSGRRLEDCLEPLEREMQRSIDAVMIWALTTWAWKREFIQYPGKSTISVFGPNTDYSLSRVPKIMNQMVELTQEHNPQCRVYLCIPACIDMYRFNQKRIINNWGSKHSHFLKDHPKLNPKNMQDHSIQTFHKFESLTSSLPEYKWKSKYCLRASDAVKKYYQHTQNPPYLQYLNKQSSTLNVDLLPDGLHGNSKFLYCFCERFQWLFKIPALLRRIEDRHASKSERRWKSPPPRKSRSSYRNSDDQYKTKKEEYSRSTLRTGSTHQHSDVEWNRPSTSARASDSLVTDISFYQKYPPPSDLKLNTDPTLLIPSTLPSVPMGPPLAEENRGYTLSYFRPSPEVKIPNQMPSEVEVEIAMRRIYNQFMPLRTNARIKKNVAGRILDIARREEEVLTQI